MKIAQTLAVILSCGLPIGVFSQSTEDTCPFYKKAVCAASLTTIVTDITNLPMPPSHQDVNAVLINGHAFLEKCGDCLYEYQKELICETIGLVIDKAEETLNVKIDFDVRSCKKDGIVGSIIDAIPSPWLPTDQELIAQTAKSLEKLGVSPDVAASSAAKNIAVLKRGTTQMMPMQRDGTVNAELLFEFSDMVSHKGTAVLSWEDNKQKVTVQGEFFALGNSVLKYDEEFTSNVDLNLPDLEVGPYKIVPSIVADIPNHVEVCVVQLVCTPWGCSEFLKTCEKAEF